MKRILAMAFFLLSFEAAKSQVLIAILFGDKLNSGKLEFGLMVSPTFSNLSQVGGKLKPSFALGLYFNIKLSDRFYLHPEAVPKLNFGAKGLEPYSLGDEHLDSLFATGSVTRSVKAIGLPLLARYRIAGLFFIEGGPQIDLITNAKDIFKNKLDDNELQNEVKIKDQFTKFDIGYVLGLAYKISPGAKGMTFGIRYYDGLTDIMKSVNGGQLSSCWFLNIFIPIGAGKGQAK